MSASSLDRLRQLAARVDAFFAAVHSRHGASMQCSSGCHDCCLPGLSCTPVEAAALRLALRSLPAEAREALRLRALAPPSDRCILLDLQGRCVAYEARPLICRSHGVPVRVRDRRGLPLVDACIRNFSTEGPGALPASDVLDQQTLSTVLLAIDALHAQEQGLAPGGRVELLALALEEDPPVLEPAGP
ncbi:MAG: YkgJ family cysteine cluster protein [Polyangiaceae bacterium]|jgi:hypothetical protein|nr:YkgJ family cysteine cluster protein [Polyangiaceae bacterium]